MALLEDLRTLAGKDLAEDRVAIGQRYDQHRSLPRLPAVDNRRLAEIDLGFARPVRQGHEDLCRALLAAADLLLNDGSAAAIAPLTQLFQNPLGGTYGARS